MGEWRYSSTFLDIGTRWRYGDEWSASRPYRFIPAEIAPGTHRVGAWVGPKFGLDDMKKRKILQFRQSNPGLQPVARHYTDRAIQTP
jgi:hypothetical protein